MPGQYEISDQVVIRCPQHGWEFDIRSGLSPDDAHLRVAVYDVRVANGRILIGPPRRTTGTSK